MNHVSIKSIRAEGLHYQFDVETTFNPGLNVLYGKNGLGKTTLLHILANVLELDFERFRYLQFHRIHIETHGGNALELIKDSGESGKIRIRIDQVEAGATDQLEQAHSSIPALSQSERSAVREMFGGRAVYLPAFRAILERVRSDQYLPESQRTPEFERIRVAETYALKETQDPIAGRYASRANEVPQLTARKTLQCREWFGPFVPIIRYPSIMEVTERLIAEVRDAHFEVASHERRMLSEMFIDVFKALLSQEEAPNESEIETLIRRIQQSLVQERELERAETHLFSDDIGNRLGAVAAQVKLLGGNRGAAERRVLQLYAEMLERRKSERTASFRKVKAFEDAVNRFLDDKTLHVTEAIQNNPRAIAEGVYIETDRKKRYKLSALSSGERQVLTMLFSATRMGNIASGVFLIDEPELSLHVDWQRIILEQLMIQAPDRQIIACTHSPEVGADHSESVQMYAPTGSASESVALDGEAGETLIDELI